MTLSAASLFTFPTDFAGAGIDEVFDDVVERAGLGEVTVAANYHAARDVFTHNPRFVAYTFQGGTAFLADEPERFAGLRLRPRVDPLVAEGFDLATLVARGAERGVRVHAWLNYCHHDITPPLDWAVVSNAFGEINPGQLCPSNPAVVDYFRALTEQAADAGARSIVAEGLHFGPAKHGYHHERWFNALDDVTTYLLGVCFCPWCQAAASSADLDIGALTDAVRRRIRTGLTPTSASTAPPLSRETLADAVGDALCAYLDVRTATATHLAREIAEAARAYGSRLTYMDPAGAIRGYSTGVVSGEVGPLPSWTLGTDLPAVTDALDRVTVMGYVRDPDVLARVVRSYRQALPAGTALGVVLRPAPPDCSDAQALADKVAICAANGADRVDFYNYAFTPLKHLPWINSATASVAA